MLNDVEIKQSKEKNTDELLLEIETLKKEKEEWKSNSSFLLALVEQLQNDNKLLHNKINNQKQNSNDESEEILDSNENITDEYEQFLNNDAIMNCYSQAYELAEKDFKFAGMDISLN
jgi:chromosome segregation ATPase